MDNKNTNSSALRSAKTRKRRLGAEAVVFSAVIIVLVIIANAIFYSLCYNLQWFSDMTSEKLYGITDASKTILSDLSGEELKVHIIFCTDEDKLEESYYSKLVHQLAMSYAMTFDFIDVQYIDIIKNPTAVNKYRTTTVTTIKTTNVIVATDNDFRVFTIDSLFTVDEDTMKVFAFNGEYKITSAILQLLYDNPTAYFTYGHGEVSSPALEQLFTDAGYIVKKIDLSKEEIEKDAKVIVINGPKYDFMGFKSEVNEIGKIADFLDSYGNLMVFLDPSAMASSDLPELEDLLYEWGIRFNRSVIKDEVNSLSADGYTLIGTYASEGITSSITENLRNLESSPKSVMRYAMPVEILWEANTIDQSIRHVAPILSSSSSAKSYSFENENEALYRGPFPIMALSQDQITLDGEAYTSYVLACGSVQFASEDYLKSNAYGNSDIIFTVMKAMGREKVPLDIDFRVFEDNTLTITRNEANVWTVILTALLPTVVALVGVGIYIKRKKS